MPSNIFCHFLFEPEQVRKQEACIANHQSQEIQKIYFPSSMSGIRDNPDTPIPLAAVAITAWNAPPSAPPIQAVTKGRPNGRVTP